MKVTNQSNTNMIIRPEQPLDLKNGDTHTAIVKEQLSDKEAIVQIKGVDVKVEFEGKIPAEDKRVNIKITDTDGNMLKVKVVGNSKGDINQAVSHIQKAPTKVQLSGLSPDLQRAINILMEANIPVNKASISVVKDFMEKANGDLNTKLETINKLIDKQLEVTLPHLEAVHEALNGDGFKLTKLQHIIQDKIGSSTLSPDIATSLEIILKGAEQLNKLGHEDTARNALTDTIKVIDEMESSTVKQPITDALDKIIHDINDKSFQSKNKLTYTDEASPINFQTKDFIVNEVTRRLSLATQQFKEVKSEITNKLDTIIRLTEQNNRSIYPNIKNTLEATIDQLDRSILKGDIAMLTDMKTEKTLLQSSSQLAIAKKHLADGETDKALKIFNNVKQELEKLNWQPSNTKVKHFVTKEIEFIKETNQSNQTNPQQKISAQVELVSKNLINNEPSAKHIFESLRSLGLNRDSEIAQHLSIPESNLSKEEVQKNIKSTILNLLSNEDGQTNRHFQQTAEKMLLNLTGQQLLSKADNNSTMQSMYFNLPITIGDQQEQVKIYLNGKKDGTKIDWENSNLYFLIETKKLGETGILISAQNRNLSLTIKNDLPSIKASMEPIFAKYKDKLQEIGYNITGVKFEKLNENKIDKQNQSTVKETKIKQSYQSNPMKGFDFKI